MVKVNCDASVQDGDHLSAFGNIIRDASGNWVKGCNGLLLWAFVLHSELFAIWRGNDILLKIIEVRQRRWNVDKVLIQRTANQAADWLARQAIVDKSNYTK
ncbi:hypothetical protein PIB30_042011 [Stylosanthes scabra]|uniref:RNase H type-1 domain-containing protein n=1 Tax=Stylosanthes scabra TaxID=79078 RepID=A0ABU6SGQ8_9FABA|nr:hypothetical protein [Stylosanthes scabra]